MPGTTRTKRNNWEKVSLAISSQTVETSVVYEMNDEDGWMDI